MLHQGARNSIPAALHRSSQVHLSVPRNILPEHGSDICNVQHRDLTISIQINRRIILSPVRKYLRNHGYIQYINRPVPIEVSPQGSGVVYSNSDVRPAEDSSALDPVILRSTACRNIQSIPSVHAEQGISRHAPQQRSAPLIVHGIRIDLNQSVSSSVE